MIETVESEYAGKKGTDLGWVDIDQIIFGNRSIVVAAMELNLPLELGNGLL
jgi:hypothetical protein